MSTNVEELNKQLFAEVYRSYSDVKAVKKIVASGADVNAVDCGVTPLMAAVKNGHLDNVRYLIEQKADVNAREKETEVTALIMAAQMQTSYFPKNRIADIMEVLLKNGADVHAVNYKKESALAWAVYSSNLEAVKLLVKHGADITVKAENGLSYKEMTRSQDILEFIQVLENQKELDGMVQANNNNLNTI